MIEELIEGLEEQKKQKKQTNKVRYLGTSVAITSILYGIYIIGYEGYFINLVQPYISTLPEDLIGAALLLAGFTKAIGIATGNAFLKRQSIYALSFLWGGLAAVAALYSFGIGYPSPSYIFTAKILADCLRISFKGDFTP